MAHPGPQPHSVTFLPSGQAPPPPGSDRSFAPVPHRGPYEREGANQLRRRTERPGPPARFSVSFPTAGTDPYVCLLHPLMTLTVNVVAGGARTETQAEVSSRGDR